jgi:hypothetical protein
MRFMMMVKSDEKSEAGVLPTEKELSEMGAYNQKLIDAGMMLAGDGLQASAKGARVKINGKDVKVIDGPFAETKELLAGFWVISAKSKAEAIEWAKRVPFKDGEIELRQIYELDDFPIDPAEQPDGWRDKETALRDAPAPPPRKPGTTRYITLIKADKLTEAGSFEGAEEVFEKMGELMEETARKGALLGGEGLQPTSNGAKVRFSGGKATVIDGPFTETKEIIAGYSILQVATKEEAIDFARRCLQLHCDWSKLPGEIEVRQFFEIEDFPVNPEEKPEGWRAQELRFRDGAPS